jgi:outer membrane protein assembly factor BamD (BamD/ComL family)
MSKSESHSSASGSFFRIIAVVVLFLSITASGLQVLGALNAIDHPDPNTPMPVPTLFIPAILSLIAGIALSSVLAGIAKLVSMQPAEDHGDPSSNIHLVTTIAELQNTLPALIADAVTQSVPQVSATADGPVEQISEGSMPTAIDPNLQDQLQRMLKLLEEMKELSMLDENQRKARRTQVMVRRKISRLEEVSSLIQQGNWAQADALLHLLESLHPGDADVLALRNQMDDARILHQADDWDRLRAQVTDLLALSQYAPAIASIQQFLERFPTHTEAQQLLQQVRQDERAYTENTTGRLYDQIKLAVENHHWRTALDGIQQFLEKYPDHPRSEKIRKQVRVIQKNAEIEERHEQEDRIKELINSRRYADAADLSEDLLARFPDSPQAGYLSDLLPKLRERSNETENAPSSN